MTPLRDVRNPSASYLLSASISLPASRLERRYTRRREARMDEPSGARWQSCLAIGIVALTIASLVPLLDMTSSPAAAQDKLYHLAANAVTMKVDLNGSLRIRERLTFRFDLGTFSFGYRDIPWKGFDDLQDVLVTNVTGTPLDYSLRFAA